MPFYILYLVAFLLAVNAIHNVTIDDNNPSIIYQPPTSWSQSVFDVLDAGGRHMVTSDSSATASFTFTGVAIYFYSPLWTFSVTTQVALDDLPPVLLDLRDYNRHFEDNGPEVVRSTAVWNQTDLANTQHTLLVSVGDGQTLAILDTLVYTVLDANDVPSSSSSSISTSTLPSSTSTPNTSTTPANSSSKKGLAVTLGVVCTVFGLLVIGGIWWFIRRRQRRGDDDNSPHHNDNDNDNDTPEMSNTTTTTTTTVPAYSSTYSRGRDTRFRSIPSEIAAAYYGSRRTTRPNSSPSSSSSTTTSSSLSPPSSTIRHSSAVITASKLKHQLTTIHEAPSLRETSSLTQRTSQSPAVQDRQRESLLLTSSSSSSSSPSPSLNGNDDRREETWTYNHNL